MYPAPITWPIPPTAFYPTRMGMDRRNNPPLPVRSELIFTNDTHEKFDVFPSLVAGFNWFRKLGEQTGKDVLPFAAGDWNIGNEPNELALVVKIHNMIRPVASAKGNHESDAGAKALAWALKLANFPLVASNLRVPKTSSLFERVQDHKLVTGPMTYTSPQGITYGIVGMSPATDTDLMNPDAKQEGVVTDDFETSLKKVQRDVVSLKQKGIRKIILVSHAGYDKDLQIAKRTDGIDIIVGGHSHTELNGIKPGVNYVRSASGEPVTIVQTGKDAKALGVLEGTWNQREQFIPEQNNLYNPKSFPKDPAAAALVDAYLGPAHPIGWISRDVETENAGSTCENGVANAVAESIRNATQSDIALFRGTELRNNLFAGTFTDRDLKVLLPFNDKIAAFKMTGAEVLAALDESARCLKLDEHHPGIMHAAGLRYVVDKQTGKTAGAMVYNRNTHHWEALNLQKVYTVASGDFVAKNKKEYPIFKQVPIVSHFSLSPREAFGYYILSQQGKPLEFPTDGRLKVIHEKPILEDDDDEDDYDLDDRIEDQLKRLKATVTNPIRPRFAEWFA